MPASDYMRLHTLVVVYGRLDFHPTDLDTAMVTFKRADGMTMFHWQAPDHLFPLEQVLEDIAGALAVQGVAERLDEAFLAILNSLS